MNKLIRFFKQWYGLFFGYLICTWLLYFQTVDAGFVTDWTGWQARYDSEGWVGVLNCYGQPILHQVLHFFSYLLYALFGTNGLPWFLVFTILHAANTTLLHQITTTLLEKFNVNNRKLIPVFTALLFLASPYQTEVVVWRVCLHYLMVVFFAMAAIKYFLKYLDTPNRKFLWLIHLFMILGLFTIELGLMTPFLILTIFLIYLLRIKVSLRPILLKIILPQFALLFGYFMLNRLLFNDWVGHYGGAAHLNFDLNVWVSGLMCYLVKHFAFIHFFDFSSKHVVYHFLQNEGVYVGYGLFVLLIILFLVRMKKMANWALLSFWSLAGFVGVVLPIVNLHFMYTLIVENDRYGYFPQLFLAFFLVLLISQLPKWFRYSILTIYLSINVFLTYQTNYYWKESGAVQEILTNDFRWYDSDETIVLASPSTFKGVMLFRIIGEESELIYCLEYLRRKPYQGRMIEAVQFNMNHRNDGVEVEWIAERSAIKVSFTQKGNWFFRNGIGASNYENDLYTISFEGGAYYMTLKSLEEKTNRIFIYPKNGKWIQFEIPN
jgi:hypothetical protein